MKTGIEKVMAKENKNSSGKMHVNMGKKSGVTRVYTVDTYHVKGKYHRFLVRRELKCFVWE